MKNTMESEIYGTSCGVHAPLDTRDDLCTVVPTKSDSDVIFCLQLLRKTFTCTLHLS